MKIYKGDVGFELTVQAFLDLLEEDALDELINTVLDLEAADSFDKGDYDGDVIYMGEVNLDKFDGDMSTLFDHITNNIEHYEVMTQEDFDNVFGANSTLGSAFMDDEEILDNLLGSNEDLRIRRIVNRFRHINEAL